MVRRDAAGMVTIEDRFITSRSAAGVALDMMSDTELRSSSYANGILTVEVSRAVDTGDSQQDISLGECQFLIGARSQTGFVYHGAANRQVSDDIICFGEGQDTVITDGPTGAPSTYMPSTYKPLTTRPAYDSPATSKCTVFCF